MSRIGGMRVLPDVIIVGGGVIGLLSAWRLAQAGLSVEVFEKSDPATESSWAGLGVLSPQAAPGRPREYVKLAQASLALYPALADELRAQTNIEIDLRCEGLFHLALDDAEVEAFRADAQMQSEAGVPVRWLSALEACEIEPGISDAVRGALHFQQGWQVDNQRLNSALVMALAGAGVKVHAWQAVTRVVSDGGRVRGVQVGGATHHADWVVAAAGAWSGTIAGLSLPVRPAKGQALMLDASGIAGFTVSHVVDSRLGYIVPRRNGRLLVGATVEDAGFDKQVDERAIQQLLAGAAQVMPALTEAQVRETWAGLRPRSADDLPLLGPVPGSEGLIAASGHFRNGILLAPITAQLVTDWVTGRPLNADAERFSPKRLV